MLKAHLGHVTLFAENPDLLAGFYRDLFGMKIVGRASSGSSVFIGGHLHEENHELGFIHNRKAAHIGLKVSSPGELLAYYQEVKARGLKIFAIWKITVRSNGDNHHCSSLRTSSSDECWQVRLC